MGKLWQMGDCVLHGDLIYFITISSSEAGWHLEVFQITIIVWDRHDLLLTFLASNKPFWTLLGTLMMDFDLGLRLIWHGLWSKTCVSKIWTKHDRLDLDFGHWMYFIGNKKIKSFQSHLLLTVGPLQDALDF